MNPSTGPTDEMASPKAQHEAAMMNHCLQMLAFDPEKHLPEREKQYCDANLTTHGLYIIRETEEGWWRESIDFKKDVPAQIQKLKDDPTVAAAWVNQQRFNEPGGWYDPS